MMDVFWCLNVIAEIEKVIIKKKGHNNRAAAED
jgi:hypothetical protein